VDSFIFLTKRKHRPSFLAKGTNYGNRIKDGAELLNYKELILKSSASNFIDGDILDMNKSSSTAAQLAAQLSGGEALTLNLYRLNDSAKGKNFIVTVSTADNINNNVTTYLEVKDDFNNTTLVKVEEWTDIMDNNNNSCIRKFNGRELLFVKNELEKVESTINCKMLQESRSDLEKNLAAVRRDL
jgi:hypothetical protein